TEAERRPNLSPSKVCLGLGGCAVLVLFLAIPAAQHSLRSEDMRFSKAVSAVHTLQPTAGQLETAIARHPADYGLHLLAGVLYLRFQDAHGLRHLNEAMLLNPASPLPHLQAARTLSTTHHESQAALEYRAAFERGYPIREPIMREIVVRCGIENAYRAMPE